MFRRWLEACFSEKVAFYYYSYYYGYLLLRHVGMYTCAGGLWQGRVHAGRRPVGPRHLPVRLPPGPAVRPLRPTLHVRHGHGRAHLRGPHAALHRALPDRRLRVVPLPGGALCRAPRAAAGAGGAPVSGRTEVGQWVSCDMGLGMNICIDD